MSSFHAIKLCEWKKCICFHMFLKSYTGFVLSNCLNAKKIHLVYKIHNASVFNTTYTIHSGVNCTIICSHSLPVYSGKQIVNGLLRIFSSNKSFLFKNKIIEVSVNHLLLQMESNSFKDSCIRFWNWKKRKIKTKYFFKLIIVLKRKIFFLCDDVEFPTENYSFLQWLQRKL